MYKKLTNIIKSEKFFLEKRLLTEIRPPSAPKYLASPLIEQARAYGCQMSGTINIPRPKLATASNP